MKGSVQERVIASPPEGLLINLWGPNTKVWDSLTKCYFSSAYRLSLGYICYLIFIILNFFGCFTAACGPKIMLTFCRSLDYFMSYIFVEFELI